MEEGSSATDSLSEDVMDLTDGSRMEVGRRKEEKARKARVSAIQNLRKTFLCRTPCTPQLTALV